MSDAPTVDDDARPRLPRGVRLRHDGTRDAWVLLAPERMVMPDENALEVLKLCDGERTVRGIVEELASLYSAEPDEIRPDVEAFLIELRDQRMVEL